MGGADKKKLVNNTVILKTFNVIRHLKIIEALFTKTNKKKTDPHSTFRGY